MNRIKVAVIGSCASRDNFNHHFVPNYKDFFKCVVSQNQMSMISLMADPIPFHADHVTGDVSNYAKLHFTTELEKSVLYNLLINDPDYVILDFYADIFYGAREINQSLITNKVWQFKKINIYKNFEIGKAISIPKEEQSILKAWTLKREERTFMRVWKNNVDRFVRWMQEQLPNCKIVINQSRFTNAYYDEDKDEICRITDKLNHHYDLDRLNRIWSEMDAYVIEKYGVRSIAFGDKKYLADPNNPWGLFYLHFEHAHYLDFRDKFLKIVVDDLLENQKKRKRMETCSVNLIKNSTFNYGKKYWTYWQDEFKIQQNRTKSNSVSLTRKNLQQDANCQIWSNAVELNADGTAAYTVSFDVRITDVSQVDGEQAIFAIRLYNKPNDIFQKDAVAFHYLTMQQFKIKNKEWTRCSFTFTPTEGRFIKVGAYLFRNGTVAWRNIQLEKGRYATPWKPGYREAQ
ncbi:DUF6270 domain-containing protein [Sporolactobacillus terrae]|uniref:DUF6270 domain-containing protein n=1 Tax=Sporolactobacillus terrae TaxID=269673 RepID=UPI001CBB9BBC|nr:DUF6270 domain-containing protein [Sporolactobacillus terrae]UAK16365.1 DUF6270 domain-containing protein [Sporolactobacillus terrae]